MAEIPNLRQEITPRRIILVGGIAALGTAAALEVRSHGVHLPTRRERHSQLPRFPEAQLLQDPAQFAGA